ncbi:MAG: hypothetical protein ACFHXK_18140 [bacterium]
MVDVARPGEVLLAGNDSALVILHAVVRDAAAAFPDVFEAADIPAEPEVFRRRYPDVLPAFEAARLASSKAAAVAVHMVSRLREYIVWHDGNQNQPLHRMLSQPAAPLPLCEQAYAGEAGWRPNFVFKGERWQAEQLAELGELLVSRHMISAAAGSALSWLTTHALRDGKLDLSDRKIAVLGAGAEMAPTRLWLEAGAQVLWLDTRAPPADWQALPAMSGRIVWPQHNVDLLTEPAAVLATLQAFADGHPLDLGLYAYAPGKAREVRLTAAMNALVDALPTELIASVTMLVSPTTPTALTAEDLALTQARIASRPKWETMLAGAGLLGRGGGSVQRGAAATTRTVVNIQGASYQAAQYLGKILMAQCWSVYGQLSAAEPKPLRVSANTAAITRTRSLDHPVFAAAFGGAAALGVETLTPRQSRCLNGLLAVHDWLNPAMPAVGQVRVHGGLHTLPYPLGQALRVAAAIGFVRAPRLLQGLFRKT